MKKKKWPFIYVAVITILTYIPILLTVVYSFNASKLTSIWEGFSLKWYRELFRDRDLGEALINSLILAVLSCTFAVLIGTSGAPRLPESQSPAPGSAEAPVSQAAA